MGVPMDFTIEMTSPHVIMGSIKMISETFFYMTCLFIHMDVVLVSLLLTFDIFMPFSSVPILDFEHVFICWALGYGTYRTEKPIS